MAAEIMSSYNQLQFDAYRDVIPQNTNFPLIHSHAAARGV